MENRTDAKNQAQNKKRKNAFEKEKHEGEKRFYLKPEREISATDWSSEHSGNSTRIKEQRKPESNEP